jgi:hypothetical protein
LQRPAPESSSRQTEFPMSVAVCAWCRPNERGEGLGAVSHGICLRHLRKLRMQIQHGSPLHAKRSRRVAALKSEGLLPL